MSRSPRPGRSAPASTLAALLAAGVLPLHAASVVYPAGANHVHTSVCPAADGINVLSPDPVENDDEFFLLGSPSQELQDELAGGDSDYTGWTFDYAGAGVSGTFHIDAYKSRFEGDHWSGSELNMRYKKGPGDPASLRWVQMITTNAPRDPDGAGPQDPPSSPYIDPYPDDADGVGGPFYYSDEAGHDFDYRDRINGATDAGFGNDYDIRFYDFPTREHPPTSWVKWQGELWLTEADTANETVTFHAGIGYGFVAGCIHWSPWLSVLYGDATDLLQSLLDPADRTLRLSPGTVTTLNRSGDPEAVDPDLSGDPMLGAQMLFSTFTEVPEAPLPPGLHLFRDGSVEVRGADGTELLYTATIPFLVVGEGMSEEYNMTGVYDEIWINPAVPSQFLQEYGVFLQDGLGPHGGADRRSRSAARPPGTTPQQAPGHSPQLFGRIGASIPAFMAGGLSAPTRVWHGFGPRNPGFGLSMKVGRASLDWGSLGTSVVYDVVRGDLTTLRATGGDFTPATDACLADDTPAGSMPYAIDPPPGEGFWFLARAVRGGIPGTYDTRQPSQTAGRDAEITASPSACP